MVFRWNDSDAQLGRAIATAAEQGITLWFDFARTWGRSRRKASGLGFLRPYLKPCTALPGELRQRGW